MHGYKPQFPNSSSFSLNTPLFISNGSIPTKQLFSKKQGKKGKGRQKIVIEKIENEANRQVTFSKRRAGLFKKASELSTLCGVESAIVVFSPSNKAHSFGNPNVETIIDKFLNLGRTENTQATSAHNNSITRMRNQELTDLESQLELEKKHKKEQNRMRKENQSQKRNPPNLDELNYKQLKELKKSIIEFKHRFETKVQKATNLAPNSHVDRLIGEGFPVTIPCGPVVGYSLDPNSDQGPNYMVDLYGNASSDPTLFDNAGASNPGATFFPNMETTTNPGFVGPFDQMASDFGGLTFPFPHEASGSNFMFPYNYGIHNDIVPNDNAQGFSGIYYGRGN